MAKKTKLEMINEVLDHRIKNLEPSLRNETFTRLMEHDFSKMGTKRGEKVARALLSIPKLGSGCKRYWLARGWDSLQAEINAKENMKIINKSANRSSPYSILFWTKKINPNTNLNYTIAEAEQERNSRRPIRKEYWIAKGHDEAAAIELAQNQKSKNNRAGAMGSKDRSPERVRAHSHRTVDYWVLRGFSEAEAASKVSAAQKLFSLDICILKYGEVEGRKIWSDRQKQWLNSLKASGLHGGYSKVSMTLFTKLSKKMPDIQFGVNEAVITISGLSYTVDCLYQNNKRIIEFFGDYWHANPSKFSAGDMIKSKVAENIWKRDETKLKALVDAGYQVLVVWESEYNMDKQGTIDKCIAFLTQ